ncbi:hypothetical protein EK21DRAFT_96405 [Setomelanomma holmii]|uniref:Uncharacterized protein n=1 Tax=Setomelanomma holmii TaxID=210430 RepID=A0A9P4HLJ3_9PLEO|nr:hypothetical protein EK21DRAFT_96405 [Setomelanomma holmii]
MASRLANIPDHWLWFGLAVKQVSAGLQNIRTLTEIRNPPPSHTLPHPERLPPNPQHQEDAIKTSSLLTLATSPNVEIRSSATKILCQRFYANETARKLLLKDMNSRDEEVQHRAALAFELLCAHGVLRDNYLPSGRVRDGWRLHEPPAETGDANAADLRRRRREAVVIHDGEVDRPIGQEDVFMRDETGRMSTEAQDEITQGEVGDGTGTDGLLLLDNGY